MFAKASRSAVVDRWQVGTGGDVDDAGRRIDRPADGLVEPAPRLVDGEVAPAQLLLAILQRHLHDEQLVAGEPAGVVPALRVRQLLAVEGDVLLHDGAQALRLEQVEVRPDDGHLLHQAWWPRRVPVRRDSRPARR